MKNISYISLLIGILLIIVEFICKYNDMLGYMITTIGILLTLAGILTNKGLRKFLVDVVLNFF